MFAKDMLVRISAIAIGMALITASAGEAVAQRKGKVLRNLGIGIGGAILLNEAMKAQARERRKNRSATSSDRPQQRARNARQGEDASRIRALQIALAAQGYDVGDPDGVWGRKARMAAMSFQRSLGTERTGRLTGDEIEILSDETEGRVSSHVTAELIRAASIADEMVIGSDSPEHEIRQVQIALKDMGLYRGSVDGAWGTGTEQAVRRYQRRRGEPDTGALNGKQAAQLIGAGPAGAIAAPDRTEESRSATLHPDSETEEEPRLMQPREFDLSQSVRVADGTASDLVQWPPARKSIPTFDARNKDAPELRAENAAAVQASGQPHESIERNATPVSDTLETTPVTQPGEVTGARRKPTVMSHKDAGIAKNLPRPVKSAMESETAMLLAAAGISSGNAHQQAAEACKNKPHAANHVDCTCIADRYVVEHAEFQLKLFDTIFRGALNSKDNYCIRKDASPVFAEAVAQCNRNMFHALYYDCTCLAAKYSAVNQSFDYEGYNRFSGDEGRRKTECVNVVGIAAHTFETCEHSRKISQKSRRCACEAGQVVSEFRRAPFASTNYYTKLAVKAASACRSRR